VADTTDSPDRKPDRHLQRRIQSQLPLKPVELLVLSMLSAGERHGYGIRQDIIDYTRGAIALEAGNLYRTIRRLESEGMLDEANRPAEAETDDERRRYYRLTPFGGRVLAAELERLRELVKLGEERRVISPLPA
jgi:DNA-binding PadR family transcriptional regulator